MTAKQTKKGKAKARKMAILNSLADIQQIIERITIRAADLDNNDDLSKFELVQKILIIGSSLLEKMIR